MIDPPVVISGIRSPDDVRSAVAFMLRRSRPRRRLWLLLSIVLYVFAVRLFWISARPNAGFVLWLLPAVFAIVVVEWTPYRIARTVAKRSSLRYEQYTVRISDDGYDSVSERDRVHRSWADFAHWSESPSQFFLVEVGRLTYRVIPKRFLAEAETDRLRSILVERLPRR